VIYSDGLAGHWSTTNDADTFGTGTPTDDVNSGTIAPSNGQFAWVPTAIIGYSSAAAVCLVGDSRSSGSIDLLSDATGDTGDLARAIGPVLAYTKLSAPISKAQAAVSNFSNRLRMVSYCTHVIDDYGINDAAAATPSATIATYRASLAALFSKPTFGTTLPAETSSTDSWATTANQTTTVDPSAFNALVRAGIAGEVGYFDLAVAVDPGGIKKWPVSRIPGAATGTTGFATTDGVHGTAILNTIIAQSGLINLQWFTIR
jgi:hypothetical protein